MREPSIDIIENDEQLFVLLGELGAEFAEHQVLTDPKLVLCEEWIIHSTEEWYVRLPKVLKAVGLESDDPDDYARAVTALMTGAMKRLDEMTRPARVATGGRA